MSDFFKQLLRQLNDIWSRLTSTQKIVTTSVIVLTFIGLVLLIVWVGYNGKGGNYVTLFSNLDLTESGTIVEKLKADDIRYQIENDGHCPYLRLTTHPRKAVAIRPFEWPAKSIER